MTGVLLVALGLYLVIGGVFALYFVTRELPRFDAVAGVSPLRFRVIIFPGCVGLWPVLLFNRRHLGVAVVTDGDGQPMLESMLGFVGTPITLTGELGGRGVLPILRVVEDTVRVSR